MTSADIIDQARGERDRMVALLEAIENVRTCKEKAEDPTLSEAGEFLALSALTAAEEKLMLLVLSPGLEAYLRVLLLTLADIAESAA
jgi:hypothetical protein